MNETPAVDITSLPKKSLLSLKTLKVAVITGLAVGTAAVIVYKLNGASTGAVVDAPFDLSSTAA